MRRTRQVKTEVALAIAAGLANHTLHPEDAAFRLRLMDCKAPYCVLLTLWEGENFREACETLLTYVAMPEPSYRHA